MIKRLFIGLVVVAALLPRPALAESSASARVTFTVADHRDPYRALFTDPAEDPKAAFRPLASSLAVVDQTPAPVAVAHEYSEAYQTRRKIHKIGSFAILPLFTTQILLGESLYNDGGEGGKKTAHAVVGSAIGGLFALNTVTGVWNLWESRSDPVGRKRRLVHSVLMMAADAGFFATVLVTPDEHGSSDNRSTHRALAYTSIGLGTAGYLVMLLTK